MAIWSDAKTEPEEIYFLEKLGQKIGLAPVFIEKSIETSNSFFTTHKDEIQYFNYSNPVSYTHLDVYKRQLIYLSKYIWRKVRF